MAIKNKESKVFVICSKLIKSNINQMVNVLINDQKKNHLSTTNCFFLVILFTNLAIIVTPNPMNNIWIIPFFILKYCNMIARTNSEIEWIIIQMTDHLKLNFGFIFSKHPKYTQIIFEYINISIFWVRPFPSFYCSCVPQIVDFNLR